MYGTVRVWVKISYKCSGENFMDIENKKFKWKFVCTWYEKLEIGA